ncbi:putative glutamine amidotransferase [Mycobacterium sp. URHB0021]|jgi:putative glutamine amidotransferase
MSALTPITVAEVMPTNPIHHTEAPLIGVIAPLDYPGIGEETRALIVRFTRSVLTTLTELGARFRIIEPTTDTPLPLDAAIDGILLLGGGDMDPALYGHPDDVPNLSGVDRRCDERTIEAVRWGLDRHLPVFGICRGAKVINVAHGGTLIPDLGPDTPHKGHGDNPTFVPDPVIVEPGTRLAGILSRTEVTCETATTKQSATSHPLCGSPPEVSTE